MRKTGTRPGCRALATLFLLVFVAVRADGADDPDAQATLVVYNIRDVLSEDLANFYAEKREIPRDQVIGLSCSTSEEISREQYDDQIAQPLKRLFTEKGWWEIGEREGRQMAVKNRIRFVALVRGVPVKIKETFNYPGDASAGPGPIANHNEAAVDSELATLGFMTRNISGALNNPYFRSYKKFREANLPPLMLVCRLDAPTGTIVRRMIEDSLEAEQSGVWGFAYIDTRNVTSGGLAEGDDWLQAIGVDMRQNGVPVVQSHGSQMFPENYPMRNAAFYFGWYSDNASGPFVDPAFKFNRGAVAVHIHSFSATMVRDPSFGWVAPLLMRGAAATTGNVYEPYLALTPHLDILEDRLRNGFTFAEACYMSEAALSWMTTFIGDPLYKPFRFFQDILPDPPSDARQWWILREGARRYYGGDKAAGVKIMKDAGQEMRSGAIFEGLASIYAAEKQFDSALEAARTARGYYKEPADILRVAIREANMLAGMNRYGDALKLLDECRDRFPRDPAIGVVRSLRDGLQKERP